ncbi:hypothetical protein D2Q93_00355 [Alicyclobacillaceae bacterium I2511]|nr:hypothetical protein D2Q93_00355 [Alicyclobacillaceae bacterium I2511]
MSRRDGWKFSTVGWILFGLILVYIAMVGVLHPFASARETQSILGHGIKQRGAAITQGSTNTVPDGVLSVIAQAVGTVKGVNELVVLPATEGSGYTVSASIAVDYSGGVFNGAQMQQLASEFFSAIYKNSPGVESAQLYFMDGNQIIGGSGLGRTIFEHMEIGTSSGQGGWLKQLQTGPQVTGQGTLDRWYAISGGVLN